MSITTYQTKADTDGALQACSVAELGILEEGF